MTIQVYLVFMLTFIKVFNKLVISFSVYRSLPRLMIHAFSKSGIEQFKNSISIPKRENLSELKNYWIITCYTQKRV